MKTRRESHPCLNLDDLSAMEKCKEQQKTMAKKECKKKFAKYGSLIWTYKASSQSAQLVCRDFRRSNQNCRTKKLAKTFKSRRQTSGQMRSQMKRQMKRQISGGRLVCKHAQSSAKRCVKESFRKAEGKVMCKLVESLQRLCGLSELSVKKAGKYNRKNGKQTCDIV